MTRSGAFSNSKPSRRRAARGHLWVLLMVLPAVVVPSAGQAVPPTIPTPYHNGATLVCSDCHTMHYSQQHEYGGAAGQGLPALSGGPASKLLRRGTALDLCLACHDGLTAVPDVLKEDTNGLADNRAAGYFPADPDATTYKGHNLKRDPGYLCERCHMGGSFGTAGATCIDCHNPHGNAGYRNLQWAAHPGDLSKPKIMAFYNGSGIYKYSQANIGYTAPEGDNTWREVSNICLDCHHVYSGGGYTGGDTSPFHRHPVTESERGAYFPINRPGANTDPTHWVNGTGNGFSIARLPFVVRNASTYADATQVAGTNEVFCLTCHQGHGSGNAFGLRWAYGSGEPGTSQAGCNQCHNK